MRVLFATSVEWATSTTGHTCFDSLALEQQIGYPLKINSNGLQRITVESTDQSGCRKIR